MYNGIQDDQCNISNSTIRPFYSDYFQRENPQPNQFQDKLGVPTKEPGLCASLEEATKYADLMFEILNAIEIKLRRGTEVASPPCKQPESGAFGASRALAQKLANLVGFAKTLDGML